MPPLREQLETALGSQYRLERELGGGGMSRVFVAEEVALGRRVAVKVLPPELAEGITADRFRREIQLAAQLQHPHIVPLLTSERAAGLVFYIMPYVEGETLRARLARDGSLPADSAVRIARDVAEALGYAHAYGVVHRDIKPENILLSSGHALVLDFGVAKALRDAAGQSGGTTAGVALGTPLYMSPEQAAGGLVDGRADLYALGIVLYEMVAGRPPFEGDSGYDLMAAHIADEPEPLRRRSAETPAALEAVVMRCLAKRAGDRFQTAGELLTELDGFATPTGDIRKSRRARRRMGRRTVLAAILAVAAAGALWLGLRAVGGPSGRSLVAQGALREHERILLADFENRTTDSSLGITVTEAFRVDLSQSPTVTLFSPTQVAQTLTRMRRDPAGGVGFESGRELAQREGINAVVGGEIATLGGRYVITARIAKAETGEVLAGFRETASAPDGVIPAVDRVSKRLRRRLGESLRGLNRSPPLDQVTTGSLEALRLYSQAIRANNARESDRAVTLLEQAVRLDTSFASAWRSLGIALQNWQGPSQRASEALARAYRLRDRLTERERHMTEASYFARVERRPNRVIAAYEAILDRYPDDLAALVGLGFQYDVAGQVAKVPPLLNRALAVDTNSIILGNLLSAYAELGDRVRTDSIFAVWTRWRPDDPALLEFRAGHAALGGRYDSASAGFRRLVDEHAASLAWRWAGYDGLAHLARLRGHLAEAEGYELQKIRAYTAGDSTDARRRLAEGVVRTGHEILVRGHFDAGVRQLEALLRTDAVLDRVPPLDRPYPEIVRQFARAGRADLARGMLDHRRRALQGMGEAGREVLTATEEDPSYQILAGDIEAASARFSDAVSAYRQAYALGDRFWHFAPLAMAYDGGADADSAIAVFERYLALPIIGRQRNDSWYRPHILYRLGELYEARGDRARAADYYSQFAELWRGADPDLQPRVAEARRRLAALTTEPGSR